MHFIPKVLFISFSFPAKNKNQLHSPMFTSYNSTQILNISVGKIVALFGEMSYNLLVLSILTNTPVTRNRFYLSGQKKPPNLQRIRWFFQNYWYYTVSLYIFCSSFLPNCYLLKCCIFKGKFSGKYFGILFDFIS